MVMQEKNNQICDFTKMSFQLGDKKGFQEDKQENLLKFKTFWYFRLKAKKMYFYSEIKELSICHKLKFSNSFIFAT